MPRRDRDDPKQPKKLLESIKLYLGYPPPLNLPKDSNAVTVSRWPEGYWLDPGYGTFFTILLGEHPVMRKDNQPLKLSPEWLRLLDSVNVGLRGRKWLVQPLAKGVLVEGDNGAITFPSPQIFGGRNPVKILETWHNFARIATLDINQKPPERLLDWMVQNCGFTNNPKRYYARMLTLFNSNSAWVYLPALEKNG